MELLSKLGIDWRLLLAQVINFLVLLLILYKFLYKPILKILAERQNRIEESLKQAEQIKKNLFESEGEKRRILEEARNGAGRILAESKARSEKLGEDLLNKAKLGAASVLEDGKKQLLSEKELMFRQIRQEASQLIVAAAEKLLKQKIDETLDKKIIEENLEKL